MIIWHNAIIIYEVVIVIKLGIWARTTLITEINAVIKNVADAGRDHLNNDEIEYIQKITNLLVDDYAKELAPNQKEVQYLQTSLK